MLALTEPPSGCLPFLVLLQIDAEHAEKGSLEMTPEWITYNRKVTLGREGAWWEVPLDTKLGLTYNGERCSAAAGSQGGAILLRCLQLQPCTWPQSGPSTQFSKLCSCAARQACPAAKRSTQVLPCPAPPCPAAPAGKPHVEVGTSKLPVVLALAAALLASGKPIHLKRKEVS